MAEEKTNDFRKRESTYKIVIGILVLVILFLGWQLLDTKDTVRTVIVEKESETQQLEKELNSLMDRHEEIKSQYSEVSGKLSEKDSVIEARAQEIKKLIASQADYYRIKRKLDYLRNSHQRYVEQIDSLFTVNRQLKEENVQIQKKFQETESQKQQITEQKKELEEKVNIGALLKAYNITVEAIHMGGWSGDKEKVVDKARRLDKIKICFTISENLIAEPGEKNVYIRIARPDNEILYKRSEDYFMFNGEKLQYSLMKTIDYQNEKQRHCVQWEKDKHVKEIMEGTYHVSIFVDGQEIGQSNMMLE